MQVEFVDYSGVECIEAAGTDHSIVRAMLVSTGKDQIELEQSGLVGRINFLMREGHASPFEHCWATFRVDVPIFVSREWVRHRTLSFNETSARYRDMEPRFYLPNSTRPKSQIGKASEYKLVHQDSGADAVTREAMRFSMLESWKAYEALLDHGVAREVARGVLPVSAMTQLYISGNLRNWLNFLALRTTEHALYEIRFCAELIEDALQGLYPATMAAWDNSGRNSI